MNAMEVLPPPSGDGSVVLDIGRGVGALVVHTAPSLCGLEIEISPAGLHGHARRTHVVVRERHVAGETSFAAVFPALAAGVYVLHGLGAVDDRMVGIREAQVVVIDW